MGNSLCCSRMLNYWCDDVSPLDEDELNNRRKSMRDSVICIGIVRIVSICKFIIASINFCYTGFTVSKIIVAISLFIGVNYVTRSIKNPNTEILPELANVIDCAMERVIPFRLCKITFPFVHNLT